MAELYIWFIDAGIDAVAASWGTVITFLILILSTVGIIKWLLFPKK